jgi:hypothetical protein
MAIINMLFFDIKTVRLVLTRLSCLLILFYLPACQEPASLSKVESYVINNNDVTQFCDVSDWLEVQIIRLETRGSESYISETLTDFTVTEDGKIIIVDRDELSKITAFDMEGNFLWSINNSDEGYEFFSSIGAVEFYEDKFEVNDESTGVFYYYDYNGNYVGRTSSAIFFEDKIMLAPNLFAFSTYGHENFDLNLIDPKSNQSYAIVVVDSVSVINKALLYPNRNDFNMVYGTYTTFTKYKNRVYYHRILTDTVYYFSGKDIAPSYTISFKHNHIGADFFLDYKGKEHAIDYINKNKNPYVYRTVKTDKYVISTYLKSDEISNSRNIIFSCFLSSLNTELCNAKLVNLKNQRLLPPFAYNDKGVFATLVNKNTYEALQKLPLTAETTLSEEEQNTIAAILEKETDEENPLLILYKIKE